MSKKKKAKSIRGDKEVSILATVRELSARDVVNRIGKSIYQSICNSDDHPMFIELKAAEEGMSTGQIEIFPGVYESAKKWWPGSVIRELAEKLKPVGRKFAKLFTVHSADDDRYGNNNPEYGRVVAADSEKENGKEVMTAVAYVDPEGDTRDKIRSGEYDTCSIEALVGFAHDGIQWLANKVSDAWGITLADSSIDTPGFASARVVSVVQELEKKRVKELEENDDDDLGDRQPKRGRRRKGGRMGDTMTLTEVKVWLGEQGITPDKVFGNEELLNMPLVKGAVDSAVEEAVEVKVAEVDKQVKGLTKERDDLKKTVGDKDKEIEKVNDAVKPYKQKEQQDKLSGLVKGSDLLKDASKKEAAYIVSRIPVVLMDADKEEQGDKIEAAIKDAQNEMKTLGITFDKGKSDDKPEDNDDDDKNKGKKKEPHNPFLHEESKKEDK